MPHVEIARVERSQFKHSRLHPLNNLRSTQKAAPALAEVTLPPHRFYYGWVIVACTFAILCIAYGVQFSFGVFMPFISADTGWDRGSLSLPYSLYIFVYSAWGCERPSKQPGAARRTRGGRLSAKEALHRWLC